MPLVIPKAHKGATSVEASVVVVAIDKKDPSGVVPWVVNV